MRLHALVALLIAIAVTTEARAAAGAVSSCMTVPSSATELTSYHDARLTDGTRYFVDVVRNPRADDWSPVRWIDMPRHHSTAIDWLDLATFPGLDSLRDETLRFTFELVSREITHAPEQNRWRALYHARVLEVCRAG